LDRLPVDQAPVVNSAPQNVRRKKQKKMAGMSGTNTFSLLPPKKMKITIVASARKFSNGHQRRKSMSALSILIGTWLVANAALVVVMSSRRDRTPVDEDITHNVFHTPPH
jgi:hypothetical protein